MKNLPNFILTSKEFRCEQINPISTNVQQRSMEKVIRFYNFLRPRLALQDYVYKTRDKYNILGYENTEYNKKEFHVLLNRLRHNDIMDKNGKLDHEQFKKYYKEYRRRYMKGVTYERD